MHRNALSNDGNGEGCAHHMTGVSQQGFPSIKHADCVVRHSHNGAMSLIVYKESLDSRSLD